MIDDNSPFNHKRWKLKLAAVMKENPELRELPKKTEILSDKGVVLKAIIKHKEI